MPGSDWQKAYVVRLTYNARTLMPSIGITELWSDFVVSWNDTVKVRKNPPVALMGNPKRDGYSVLQKRDVHQNPAAAVTRASDIAKEVIDSVKHWTQ